MLFNSIIFLCFFVLVFFAHWFIFSKNAKWQNSFLLVTSFVFYSFWDWRFLFLLIFSISSVYLIGERIDKLNDEISRKRWMRFGVFLSLGVLFFFKYFNFFTDSIFNLLHSIGIQPNFQLLNIVLPVAISFYTFHGVSYVLDIYHRKIQSTKSWLDYALFVSYFPLLVAGPIERATHLLPQLRTKRIFSRSDVKEGLSLMLWGFFKKIAVADSLGTIANMVFESHSEYSSIGHLFGAFIFALQIYADFSGYTDIARGVSRFFGIQLLLNFNFPYFSRSIPEFWSRWHISLSSFLNDYVFLPLALFFRNHGKWGIFISIFITFLISGFWHGAGWNFVFWGSLHGLYYLPQFLKKGKKLKSIFGNKSSDQGWLSNFSNRLLTFSLVVLALIFFRSKTISDGFYFVYEVFVNKSFFAPQELLKTSTHLIVLLKGLAAACLVFGIEYLFFKRTRKLEHLIDNKLKVVVICLLLLFFGSFENSLEFIYFQF